MLGRDEMKKAGAEASRRLLLLSDGLLNRGIVDPEAVRHVVSNRAGVANAEPGFRAS